MCLSPNQYIGAFFEIYGAMLLNAERRVNEDNFNHPYDWTLEGEPVNAKAALLKINPRDGQPRFVFKLHATQYQCRFFWLAGYTWGVDSPIPLKSWFIPAECVGDKSCLTLSLADKGRWAKYEVTIDYNLLYSRRFLNAIKDLRGDPQCQNVAPNPER